MNTHRLFTKEGAALTGQPWNRYPRPQMKRDSFLCLNGTWEFGVAKTKEEVTFDRTIRLPFCPESALSGIEEHFAEGSLLCYRKTFSLPEGFLKGRLLLHIGAADQCLTCVCNGVEMGSHQGGYDPITFDLTDCLQEENTLIFYCTDDLTDKSFPYGKQTLTRGGMWYTPVSGIWQTVWLESVPDEYIRSLRIDADDKCVTITAQGADKGVLTLFTDQGEQSFEMADGKVSFSPKNPHLWSPEDPYLYDFTLSSGEDTVTSYFAMRKLEIKEVNGYTRLCLNGKPYFFHGLLDQGYWPDGLFTPATPENYARDVQEMKELGFNMLRKHIKIEPEEFYYQCDKQGMVVFQDMVNNGGYSFFKDTVLPTIGLKRVPDFLFNCKKKNRTVFEKEMEKTVKRLHNHPCIVYWTIFNEGWGQFSADKMYDKMKKLDDSRFVDATSGWFWRKKSDVDSHHVYFKKVDLKAGKMPLVLSEFGGYSFKPEGHVFNTENTYGYGKFEAQEAFEEAFFRLYEEEVLPHVAKGLCAAVYTQVSDVEDETNGLLSYDRAVRKINAEKALLLAEKLKNSI